MDRNILNTILLFLSFWSLQAQEVAYLFNKEKITVEDGLSNRFVRTIKQDAKGFMWFGTKNGLNRYDGYQFKTFTSTNSKLQSNFINEIYEDIDGYLWINHTRNNGSKIGLSTVDVLDVHTLEVRSLEDKIGAYCPFKIKDLNNIAEDGYTKWLYLITQKGSVYIYKGKGKIEFYFETTQTCKTSSFYIGKAYNWLALDQTVYCMDKKGQLISKVGLTLSKKNTVKFISEPTDSSIDLTGYWALEAEDRPIYRLGINGTVKIQSNQEILQPNKDNKMRFNSLIKEGDLSIRYSLYALFIFNRSNQVVFQLNENKLRVNEVYIDQQKNIWVATNKEGVFKISYQKNQFKTYFRGTSIRGITTIDKGGILTANSYRGQHFYDLNTQKKITINTGGIACYNTKDETGTWISTERVLLRKVDNVLIKKLLNLDQDESIRGAIVYKDFFYEGAEKNIEKGTLSWSIYEDKKERVWIATSEGIAFMDKEDRYIHKYTDYGAYTELKTASINYFYENEAGIWIASSEGLYQMNKEGEIVARYASGLEAPFKLPFDHILHLHEDKQGNFWMATRGAGIIKLDVETGDYKQWTKEQGLSHNLVYGILEDKQGMLWMSSDNGLMRFDPRTNVVTNYLPKDGIPHKEFNHTALYKAKDGGMYFGGLEGLVYFNPEDFSIEKSSAIPLRITRYQYFDGEKSELVEATQALIKNSKIELDYTDRFFTLDFALLDFTRQEKGRYAYKIEGLEKDWNYLRTNSIRINGLSAGEYTLLIKGELSNGTWSRDELRIPIVVKQPFYLTWQFWLTIGFLVILLLLGYSRWRVIQLRRKQVELEQEVQKRTQKIEQQATQLRELDHLKSRFFANISHELRTPLTLILGPVGAILEDHYGNDLTKIKKALEVVKRNGLSLQELIEEILVLSKLEAQGIDLEEKKLFLFPLIRRLFSAFEAQAHLQEIKFELNFNLDQEVYVLLDEKKFEKILNNLLSNALKYTPRRGSIQLNLNSKAIESEMLYLELAVIDSGNGIHPEDLPYIFDRFYQSKQKKAIVQGGTGIGLALTYEFIQILGGKITVESTLGKGSDFSLSMPIKLLTASEEELLMEEMEVEQELVLPIKKEEASSQTILVVEDNEDMRAFLADLLGPYYTVITAENGRIGMDVLAANEATIDLIVSDVMMPEMDGFELLKRVKEHPNWKQLPMIMLTARAAEQDKLFALRIGVDDYLQKPFSRQELLVRIHNLLQNYTQRKAWQTEEVEVEEEIGQEVRVELAIKNAGQADKWMEDLETITKREVGNTQFNITSLAYDLNISERQLRRKIKNKTGLTPNQYFRTIKLDKAREYLENRRYETVSEIAYKIGFSNVQHFSKIYQQQYGKKPIEYLRN